MTTVTTPTRCRKDDSIIVAVWVQDPTRPRGKRRTSISLHIEQHRRFGEMFGGGDWVLRIAKHVAENLPPQAKGANLSRLVLAEIEADKDRWRQAIEAGAFGQ